MPDAFAMGRPSARTRGARLGAAALMVAVACLALAGPAGAASIPRSWFGVTATSDYLIDVPSRFASEANVMAQTGIGTVRVPFYWSMLQPYQRMSQVPAGQRSHFQVSYGIPTDFSQTDAMVAAATANRMTVLPVVLGAPRWAAVGRNPAGPVVQPRRPADYAHLLTALIHRYGPQGSFWRAHPELPKNPQRRWDVWNEPDHPSFWLHSARHNWVTEYIALLKAARAAIKRADRGAVVVMGALTGPSWANLGRLYASGLKGLYDVLALDTYTAKVSNVVRTLAYDQATLRRWHDGSKPMMVTELSWPASRNQVPQSRDVTFSVSEPEQAKLLSQAFSALARVRKQYRLQAVYWFTWLSTYNSYDAWEYTGLRKLQADGSIVDEPSMTAFRNSVKQLQR